MERLVSYLRVSTDRQGRSGLGLEAQRATVMAFLAGRPLLAEFVEVESGRKAARPKLAEALRQCRLSGATLIVANVSRLTRDPDFVRPIFDAGVDVQFCDLPKLEGPAGRFMLRQMLAVAEFEAGLISSRTKAALAAARDRGVKLGGFKGRAGTREDCQRATAERSRRADDRALDLRQVLAEVDPAGALSLRALAAALEARGVRLPRGGTRWTPSAVLRLHRRLAALEAGQAPSAA
jgi:DNA invertase Pin-like site-specific DNA recombinase